MWITKFLVTSLKGRPLSVKNSLISNYLTRINIHCKTSITLNALIKFRVSCCRSCCDLLKRSPHQITRPITAVFASFNLCLEFELMMVVGAQGHCKNRQHQKQKMIVSQSSTQTSHERFFHHCSYE